MRACTMCHEEKPEGEFYGGKKKSWYCKECMRARARQHYYENRERCNASSARWYHANRGRAKALSINGAAKRRGASERITTEDLQAVIEKSGDQCSYCLGPWTDYDHIQSIILGGRNHRDNLALACRSCNSKKAPKNRTLIPHIASSFWPPSDEMLKPRPSFKWEDGMVVVRRKAAA